MAAFKIHEDIENYPKYAHKKIAKIEGKISKKSFLENGSVLNGFKVDANNEKYIGNNFITSEKSQSPEDVAQTLAIDVSVLEIEKSNQAHKPENNGEYFPPNLSSNDEYRADTWKHLTELERTFPQPRRNYMVRQNDISWHSRAILVDWLASVSDEYNLSEETFHLTINYLDRFLSHVAVVRSKLQLVGVTAMRLASKMEEYYPMDCKEWSYLTDNTYKEDEILKMEIVMLKMLKFKMQAPTILCFLQVLSTEYQMEDELIHMAKYVIELVLLYDEHYHQRLPSVQAAAAIVFARYLFQKSNIWPEPLKKFTGYSLKELSPVLSAQLRILRHSHTTEFKAIPVKYSAAKYSKVSERRIS